MQIRGMVLSVRPWDFKAQSGERVQMLSLEVHDETAGSLRCEMRDNGFQPARKSDVVGTVTGIKKARFGDGVIMTVKDVQLLAGGDPAPTGAQGAIPPAMRPPEASTAVKDFLSPALGKK